MDAIRANSWTVWELINCVSKQSHLSVAFVPVPGKIYLDMKLRHASQTVSGRELSTEVCSVASHA
jgi:hypothetical protein